MTGADIPPGWDDLVMAFKLGHLEGQMDRMKQGSGGGGRSADNGAVHSSEGGDFEAWQRRAREKLAASEGR